MDHRKYQHNHRDYDVQKHLALPQKLSLTLQIVHIAFYYKRAFQEKLRNTSQHTTRVLFLFAVSWSLEF